VRRDRARAARSADNARDQVLAQQHSALIAIRVAASRKQTDLAEYICDEIVAQRLRRHDPATLDEQSPVFAYRTATANGRYATTYGRN
jgi:hypothetical protein